MVFCENLRFPAVFCENLRFRNAVIPRKSENQQKSAKICETLRIWLRLSLLVCPFQFPLSKIRKLEKAVAVRNSLLERFSGKFRGCWKILHRSSGSAKCYPCQGLGIFRQGKRLLENWPRLRERCWILSSETATAFLSSSDKYQWRGIAPFWGAASLP